MEELLAKHRKEKRDLQARITQKKKNATKKTRKGVNDECERLERELAERQQAEIQELEPKDPNVPQEALENLDLGDQPGKEINGEPEHEPEEPLPQVDTEEPTPADQSRQRKPNRQKARLARRAAEQEAQAAAAALEAENLPDLREQELAGMKEQMGKLGLAETLIRPDGHCLFSACAHSMPPDLLAATSDGNKKEPYEKVRYAAAEFMARHPEDFEAFMEEPLNAYVGKIRDTAEWGGELELQAIARSYNVEINVLQASGRVERISSQDGSNNDAIWLAYYRHSFGLGEHYNALKKVDKS
ncbi:uncharacterized protein Z520_01556 [Fonsecaea multimorphosa CBS 102226]|uniref:OTU domain-containing protein n=1 Tax=Fonsecaea multimorphosa CBS 102226 TaxID=1442371 RepID=A0A0D2L1Z1_9EURO|nr:uncharacterized protein Z520_01556 [Fonsecaea multimorphosa CBS 102226]KIY03089.1 hypothetical protein Z520_01556 [Fonsecaea multimorphosa CBS 102226]OAL30338.1 hypothetical protein AYO22_01535 [Fonsecaea multimorphosa]